MRTWLQAMIYIVIVTFGLSSIVLLLASYWSFDAGSYLLGAFTLIIAATAISIVVKAVKAIRSAESAARPSKEEGEHRTLGLSKQPSRFGDHELRR